MSLFFHGFSINITFNLARRSPVERPKSIFGTSIRLNGFLMHSDAFSEIIFYRKMETPLVEGGCPEFFCKSSDKSRVMNTKKANKWPMLCK